MVMVKGLHVLSQAAAVCTSSWTSIHVIDVMWSEQNRICYACHTEAKEGRELREQVIKADGSLSLSLSYQQGRLKAAVFLGAPSSHFLKVGINILLLLCISKKRGATQLPSQRDAMAEMVMMRELHVLSSPRLKQKELVAELPFMWLMWCEMNRIFVRLSHNGRERKGSERRGTEEWRRQNLTYNAEDIRQHGVLRSSGPRPPAACRNHKPRLPALDACRVLNLNI